MHVFISYALKDKYELENLIFVFKLSKIRFWYAGEISTGTNITTEVKNQISNHHLCVCIATKNSIESHWITTETTLALGQGKKVIVFSRDSSIEENDLPPLLHGSLMCHTYEKLVTDIQKSLRESRKALREQIHSGDAVLNNKGLRMKILEVLAQEYETMISVSELETIFPSIEAYRIVRTLDDLEGSGLIYASRDYSHIGLTRASGVLDILEQE